MPDVGACLYATGAYLNKIGRPKTPEDLLNATFLGFSNKETNDADVQGLKAIGIQVTKEKFFVITESHFVHWALTKQGVGIGVMPSLIAEAEQLVQKVLQSLPPLPVQTWLVSQRELTTNRRIWIVFDFIESELLKLMQ